MDDAPFADEVARNRWLAITLLRIGGVAMVVVGMLTLRAVVPLPEWAGYGLLAFGLVDVFLVPVLLARRWRTPPQ